MSEANEKMVWWRELTPAQRDEVIHEKVMGKELEICREESRYAEEDGWGWHCECGATGSWTNIPMVGDHFKRVPPYTQSLDAAWLVVRKMNEPIEDSFTRYAKFIDELEKIVGSDLFFDLFFCDPQSEDQHLTGERLCIAALRVCGYTVVSEE